MLKETWWSRPPPNP